MTSVIVEELLRLIEATNLSAIKHIWVVIPLGLYSYSLGKEAFFCNFV